MENIKECQSYKELLSALYRAIIDLSPNGAPSINIESLYDFDSDKVFDGIKSLILSLIRLKKTINQSDNDDCLNNYMDTKAKNESLQLELALTANENAALKETNSDLLIKIDYLQTNLSYFAKKFKEQDQKPKENKREQEQQLINRERRVNPNGKTHVLRKDNEKISRLESKRFSTPHKRAASIVEVFNKDNPPSIHRQTIKSVKFEYFMASNKVPERSASAKGMCKENTVKHPGQPNKRLKAFHARSTSDAFLSFKKIHLNE